MFFVMLNHPSKNIPAVPMTDEDGDVAFYKDRDVACTTAEESSLGETYGFEVFELGASY